MVVSTFIFVVIVIFWVVLSVTIKNLFFKYFEYELIPCVILGFLLSVALTVLWSGVASCSIDIEKVPKNLIETYEIVTIENGYAKKHIFLDKYGKVHDKINGYYPEACVVEHYRTVPVWRYGLHFSSADYYIAQ